MAMLTVLETLEPTEQAVYVLHQVFDMSYSEIADAIGKSTAAVRRSPGGHASMWPLGGRGCR
jgi:RNA polymerase sigma-70 factor (ECF subfamily)